MSHFTVLVIADDYQDALAPFQENNNGDAPTEILEFNDCTEEVKASWNGETAAEKEKYVSIEDYAQITFGYKSANGLFGYYENPNAKWDWYQVGGRWSGFFRLKESCTGTMGQKSLFSNSTKTSDHLKCDQACKKNIDFEGMDLEAEAEAIKEFKLVKKVVDLSGEKPKTWSTIVKEYPNDIEKARSVYSSQPMVKALTESEDFKNRFSFDCIIETYFLHTDEPEKNYINFMKNNSFNTYAVIKDGKWYSKGEMGWFGCSFNEVDKNDWALNVRKMIEELPDDAFLTLVDCHI